ncbi:MAG TPA: pyridoxal-dependent decarboxylase [Pyrinomonadaceae bacterium]|nr:pyridoxal-dependent decarboxylase [Pyrinomonadaceae bacterium]
MNEAEKSVFLGDGADGALDEFSRALIDHVLPFVVDWWNSGKPIPTDEEIARIRQAIESRRISHNSTWGYEQIPELLSRLATGLRFNKRNFINIHPSPFLPSVLSSLTVALQNPNNIVEEVSRPTWEMERECVDWLAKNLLQIAPNEQPWGNIVSGGTIANMTALLVARDYTYDKLSRPRPGKIGARGVIGYRPGVVLGTAGSHYSLKKALWFLGIGHENLISVPVCWDENVEHHYHRERRFLDGIQGEPWRSLILDSIQNDRALGEQELRAFYEGEQCPFSLQPLGSEILKTLYSCFQFNVPLIACVLTLGTTDTGTIERLNNYAIGHLKAEDVYIHADAATSGFAFLSDAVKSQLVGIDKVDSFTIDAHKMGFLHYPCGAVIFRNEGFKHQIYHEAPYLGPLAPTLEGSRAGGGTAALWYALRTIESGVYEQWINHLLEFTGRLVTAFASSGKYQVLHKVDLNMVAVAPLPFRGETRQDVNDLVRLVREKAKAQGEFLINTDRHLSGVKVRNSNRLKDTSSDITDIEALRIVVTNPLVDLDDAQRLVDALVQQLDDARASRK